MWSIITGILNAFQVVKELIALIKMLLQLKDDINNKESVERDQKRDEAVDKAVEAKTPEEAYAAQDGIINNQP